MRVLESSPLIENCIFRDNYAENTGGGLYGGDASLVIRNCLFLRNVAAVGAGINLLGPSQPRIESCTFTRNTADGMAGGVNGDLEAEITLVDCTMENNRAGDGAAATANACRMVLEDCDMVNNVSDFGGAVSCLSATIVITGCTISGDSALVWGGAMAAIAGSLLVAQTEISSNFAIQEGGAVFLMDAVAVFDSCQITDNRVGESKTGRALAGGFYLDASSRLRIRASRIAGNGTAVHVHSPGGPPVARVDAVKNWWGDDTGPYHPVWNPKGLGDAVSDYVDFIPWEGMTPVADPAPVSSPHVALLPNFPNPFSRGTTLPFAVCASGEVRLFIFDARGRRVRLLTEWIPSAGEHGAHWDGSTDEGAPCPSGVYFCRLETPAGTASRKVLLLR